MEGRRPATEAIAAEGTSSVDAVGTSFGRAQELLRHSRDYHAYVGGTPISGTPLATPVTSGARGTSHDFLSRLEKAERRDQEVDEERSARASAAVRAKVAEKAAAKKAKKKKKAEHKAAAMSSAAAPQQQQKAQKAPPPPPAQPRPQPAQRHQAPLLPEDEQLAPIRDKIPHAGGRALPASASRPQQQQSRAPEHPHALRHTRATNSMQNLLDADNPVSQPVSAREEDERRAERRAAARGLDLRASTEEVEQARTLLNDTFHQRGRMVPPRGLASPASTPGGGTPVWGTPPITPQGSSVGRRHGRHQGRRQSGEQPGGRQRRASHDNGSSSFTVDAVLNGMVSGPVSVLDGFGAGRARSLSVPSSTPSANWSNLAGSIFDGARKQLKDTVDAALEQSTLLDSVAQSTVAVVNRAAEAGAQAGSYLPPPPIPSAVSNLASRVQDNVADYLPAPGLNPGGVMQAFDNAVSEVAPNVVAYAGVGGMAGGARLVGVAATEYLG